jgi:transposase-like protein
MGKQKPYSWEFKLQMVQRLSKGTHNMSQMSRDYHVTRSLLYAWIRLYQERGEAAFVPDRATAAPPEIERPEHAEERVAQLERLCGQQALELDLLRSEVDVLKKAWHQLPPVP